MLRLLLLRHAKAAWPAAGTDLDRPLADRGRSAAKLMGRYLKDEGLIPDLVLVSPSRRTRETWDIVASALGPIETRLDGRIYDAATAQLLAVLHDVGDAACVLLIGHNPGFEDTARALVAHGDREMVGIHKFPTAGLAVIDFPHDAWADVARKSGRLERFVTPKALGGGEDD